MTPISLFDQLSITRREGPAEIEFVCGDPTLPCGDDNLVVRAATLFVRNAKVATNLRIELAKKIPHGAGLGGGSSDAATTLLGLNDLFEAGLEPEELAGLAAQLGSDVPFFIYRSAAICRGRGELVAPVVLPEKLSLLLMKPAFGVPTPWAYSRWKNSEQLRGIRYARQEFSNTHFVNDLERPVFEKHIFLAQMKTWLLSQAEVGAAMLSGSGSTVFAALREGADSEGLARRAKADLDPELWTCACETL